LASVANGLLWDAVTLPQWRSRSHAGRLYDWLARGLDISYKPLILQNLFTQPIAHRDCQDARELRVHRTVQMCLAEHALYGLFADHGTGQRHAAPRTQHDPLRAPAPHGRGERH
jgi:hypothetical protein